RRMIPASELDGVLAGPSALALLVSGGDEARAVPASGLSVAIRRDAPSAQYLFGGRKTDYAKERPVSSSRVHDTAWSRLSHGERAIFERRVWQVSSEASRRPGAIRCHLGAIGLAPRPPPSY